MPTPLKERYRTKSGKVLKELFPAKSVVETYLLYSGGIELSLAQSDRMVIAHTNKFPVYEFWWTAAQAPDRIAKMAEEIFPMLEDEMFDTLQEKWHIYSDPVYRSALFYILNRCSSTAAASHGVIDRAGLNPVALSQMKRLDTTNLYIVLDKHHDLEDNINTEIKSDYKLFPVGEFSYNLLDRNMSHAADLPYVNHLKLLAKLKKSDYKWAVLYKNHEGLFNKNNPIFNSRIIMMDKYGRKTNKLLACEEVIFANF